jgi:hypothetical protein
MSSGSSGGGGSSSTSVEMPEWLRPYTEKALQTYGRGVYGEGFDPANPNQSVTDRPENLDQQIAGFTPDQLAAMNTSRGLTDTTQGLANQGVTQAGKTLAGDYLDPASNPYLKGTYDAAAAQVANTYSTATAPGIMAAAQRAGQFGSSAMDESMALSRYDFGENLNSLASNIYGGNYANERNRQLQTQQMLPQTLETAYYPQQQLMSIGAQNQEQLQSELDTNYLNSVSQFEYPFNLLSGLLGAASQAGGGGGTSNTVTKSKGSGGTVICTELHRQGIMADAMYEADSAFGATLSREVMDGYQRWGVHVAAAMRRSKILTRLIAPIVLRWGAQMQFLFNGQGKANLIGWLILRVGIPICGYLGKRGAK